ncbi:hypothetical protein [Nocardia sp. BMG51109]|uniref:hypothetical protein n=1 Tax=Nocardia sp. BMG51109 TaxID=1056816 RepID=UPI000466A42B|nr:hypothetical protein [Nocardia sp. BMG51109]
MEDVLLPIRPAGSPVDSILVPQYLLDAAPPSGAAAVFADSSDRLVRHLFDVGLQLHAMRSVFDRPDATSEETRAAGEAIGLLLDDLDMLIRDAGLAMLALTVNRPAVPERPETTDLSPRRRRRRRPYGLR